MCFVEQFYKNDSYITSPLRNCIESSTHCETLNNARAYSGIYLDNKNMGHKFEETELTLNNEASERLLQAQTCNEF